ncbi:MAG: cytochrome d ubiquinol oxidase subunit II [Desulfobacteraceae bacterium]|nr:MAG: cytochrome d ubiquinol oxidase subunit II [Desulfobacteraceae bacterium]
MMDLVHLWLSLVGLVIILYVVLDGFSLGVGLLFPSAADEKERDQLMGSIGPVWDANQTWIVFGGGALFASFPMIYSVIFSALYIPLLTFIFGLLFRGVAFEFRANAVKKQKWNRAFFLGSLVASIAQGVTLGSYLSGTSVVGGHFGGGPLDWLNPFSLTIGIALIPGYMLLGSTYLIMKTTGPVQERAFGQAFRSGLAVACFIVVVSVWTPIHDPAIPARLFTAPRVYVVWVFPLLAVLAFVLLFRSLRNRRREFVPFVCSVLIFLSGYFGFQAGIYPYVIPPEVTLYEAAAQRETLLFTLWGVILVLPVVLGYTMYSYWVFRGKLKPEEEEHEGY